MTATVQDGTIVLACAGGEFIRARVSLGNAIGAQCKVGRGTLTVPLSCADLVMRLYPMLDCAELQGMRDAIVAHQLAVQAANTEFSQADTSRIPQGWVEVLDVPQQYAVNAMIYPGLRGACLFDEQGTGKTVMTSCWSCPRRVCLAAGVAILNASVRGSSALALLRGLRGIREQS